MQASLTPASVYDLEQEGNIKDIGFFCDAAYRREGPVLEIGCGTGRLAIPLAEAGKEVVGLDISMDMLHRFRGKIECLPLGTKRKISIVRGDAKRFAFKKSFQTAICSSNTLFLLESERAIAAALRCVRSHLLPDGIFIIDVDAISAATRMALMRYPLEDVADIALMSGTGDRLLQRTHSIEALCSESPRRRTASPTNRFKVSYRYLDTFGAISATRREDVFLLTPEELLRLVREQGFEIAEKLAWYDKRPFTGTEHKLIIIARNKE